MVVFWCILTFLFLSFLFNIYSLLISRHLKSFLGGILLITCCWAVDFSSELTVDLLHLVLHFVLLPCMNRIHDLYRILLVSNINFPSLSCLILSYSHLFVNPMRFRLMPLLFYFIACRYKLIVISELCLQIYATYVLIELLGFFCFNLFNRWQLPLMTVLLHDFLVVIRGKLSFCLSVQVLSLDLHVEELPHLLLHLVFHFKSELLSSLKLVNPSLLGDFILLISRLESLKLSWYLVSMCLHLSLAKRSIWPLLFFNICVIVVNGHRLNVNIRPI